MCLNHLKWVFGTRGNWNTKSYCRMTTYLHISKLIFYPNQEGINSFGLKEGKKVFQLEYCMTGSIFSLSCLGYSFSLPSDFLHQKYGEKANLYGCFVLYQICFSYTTLQRKHFNWKMLSFSWTHSLYMWTRKVIKRSGNDVLSLFAVWTRIFPALQFSHVGREIWKSYLKKKRKLHWYPLATTLDSLISKPCRNRQVLHLLKKKNKNLNCQTLVLQKEI